MEALPFLLPIAVFALIGLVVRIMVLRQLRQLEHQKNNSGQ